MCCVLLACILCLRTVCCVLCAVCCVLCAACLRTHENLSHARSVLRPAGRCTGVSAHGSSRHDQNKSFQHPPIPRVTFPIPFTHAGYGGQAHGWPSLGENCPWDAKNFLVRAQRFAPAGARASVHGRRGAPKLASRTKSLHFVNNFNSPDVPHSSNIGKEHCSR